MTISETGAALRKRRASVRELVDDTLRVAKESQPRINAFITICEEEARARATELDALLARGVDLGPLHGVPIAHKDSILTKGIRTTGGSKILRDYVPTRDAAIVKQWNSAGAVTIGKTNLHELTYGITSINPHYGPVRNPANPDCVAGGSSGGSAAVVAAGIVPLATGTDTGGSIRIPAAFCGCVGIKPTFRSISRRGVMPLSYTQDHVGFLANTVDDCALAGGWRAAVSAPRISVPTDYFTADLHPDVEAALGRAQTALKAREIAMPGVGRLTELARITLLCEAAAILTRHSGRADDFGADVWALIEQGRNLTAVEYIQAQQERHRLARTFARIWNETDCLLTPTTPFPAFLIQHTGDPRPATTRFTRPFNLLGWPAMSVPCGHSKDGLPIGLQLIAPHGREDVLIRAGLRLEAAAQAQ